MEDTSWALPGKCFRSLSFCTPCLGWSFCFSNTYIHIFLPLVPWRDLDHLFLEPRWGIATHRKSEFIYLFVIYLLITKSRSHNFTLWSWLISVGLLNFTFLRPVEMGASDAKEPGNERGLSIRLEMLSSVSLCHLHMVLMDPIGNLLLGQVLLFLLCQCASTCL